MSLMLLAAGRWKKPKVKYTKTFTANGTFPVPAGVATVDLSGFGAAGAAGYYQSNSKSTYIYSRAYRRAGGTDLTEQYVSGWVGPGAATGSNTCDPQNNQPPIEQGGSTVYFASITCYTYYGGGSSYIAPTTGASATGFGKSFAGGAGGPVTAPTTFSDVPVTGGANYPIVVPPGGSLTITYYL